MAMIVPDPDAVHPEVVEGRAGCPFRHPVVAGPSTGATVWLLVPCASARLAIGADVWVSASGLVAGPAMGGDVCLPRMALFPGVAILYVLLMGGPAACRPIGGRASGACRAQAALVSAAIFSRSHHGHVPRPPQVPLTWAIAGCMPSGVWPWPI